MGFGGHQKKYRDTNLLDFSIRIQKNNCVTPKNAIKRQYIDRIKSA